MKNIYKIISLSLLLLVGANAQAFKVITNGGGTNATHVLNLDIGGTLYDVTFVTSLASNFQDCANWVNVPCDLYAGNGVAEGDQTGADLAATVIAAALNEDISIGGNGSPTAVSVGGPIFGEPYPSVLAAWWFNESTCFDAGGIDGTCAAHSPNDGAPGGWDFLPGIFEALDTSEQNFARFSPGGSIAIVPIPPAAWLFGSALGLLGWVKRRARRAASETSNMA